MHKIVSKIIQIYKSIFGFWHANVWLIEGTNTRIDQTFSIIHLGTPVQKNYIASVFFDKPQETHLGQQNILQIFRLIIANPYQASFLIMEGRLTDIKLLKCSKSFFLPQWLDSTLAIPITASSQGAKSDLKKIRRHQLTYELSHAAADIDEFYHQMYLPYLNNRYQGQDIPMNYHKFKSGYLLGEVEILFILHQGKRIAGQVIDYAKKQPRLWAVGVLNSDKEYLAMACIGACYVFAAQHLADKNYPSMHIGKSRPIILDGALQFKIKWGMKITDSLEKGFLIKPLKPSKNRVYFFEQTPFIYKENNILHSAVVSNNFDSLAPQEINEIKKRNLHMLPGIKQLNIFRQFDHSNQIKSFPNLNDEKVPAK